MVVIDGKAEYSCAREVATVAVRRVETVESLGSHPLRQAFLDEQAGQCGYCLSGILMSAKALLDDNKNPTRAEIVAALGSAFLSLRRASSDSARRRKAAAALHEGAPA